MDVLNGYHNINNQVSSDNIFNIYMLPKNCVKHDNIDEYNKWTGQDTAIESTHTVQKITSLDGYVPVNKKLLTYPYVALLMSNNNGSSNTLKYEDFSTNNCQFEIKSTPTVRRFNKMLTP